MERSIEVSKEGMQPQEIVALVLAIGGATVIGIALLITMCLVFYFLCNNYFHHRGFQIIELSNVSPFVEDLQEEQTER